MNVQQLKEAGFNDQEVQGYVASKTATLKTAGFSDIEIDAKYGPSAASSPNPPPFEINHHYDKAIQTSGVFRPEDGDKARQAFSDFISAGFWTKPWEQVGYSSAEAFNRGTAVMATHLDTIAQYIADKTGTERGGIFEKAAKQYNENADYWKKRADEVGTAFFPELLGEAAGGAIPGVGEFLLNVPYAGALGAAEAHKDGGNEVGAALVAAAKRGILGAVFHVINPLQQYLRTPITAGIFAAQTATEGGDVKDIVKAGATGALYSATSPGGRYGLNELRDSLSEGLRRTEKQVTAAQVSASLPPDVTVDRRSNTDEAQFIRQFVERNKDQMAEGKTDTAALIKTAKEIWDKSEGQQNAPASAPDLASAASSETGGIPAPSGEIAAPGPSTMAPEAGFRRAPAGNINFDVPMSRSEIKEFLQEKLDIPIRTGRFTEKALGIFKPRSEVVRTQKANDIEVISHEVGHALQKYLWPQTLTAKGLSSQPFTAFKGELDPLATKPRAGQEVTPEGYAEFIRLYVTDAPKAQRSAPTFYNYFESQLDLKAPEVKEILLEARNRYDLYMKQPALKRVLSQISVGENPVRPTKTFDELYTAMVDELHPLEKAVKEMAQGQGAPISKDPYRLARLMKGWTGKAEAFLKNKPFEYGTLRDVPGSKSLKEIIDPIRDNLDEFRAYAVAKRAQELSGRSIDTGILPADAAEVVKEYDGKFKRTLDDLKTYQDHTLTYLQESGILDAKMVAAMRVANQDYVPFYRVMEDTKGYGVGRGLQAYDPVKGIKGSWRDIVDPLESIIKNTFTYINLAEKNAVGRALVDLAKSKAGLGKFVEKIPTPMRGIEVKPEELAKWAQENGLAEGPTSKIDPATLDALTVFRPNAFTPKDNVISIWIKGKRELYQVHPDIARTFQALDAEQTNIVLKILSKPASWLRAGATLTPEFIARNPLRDQWSAFINTKYGFVPGFDTVQGIFAMAKKTDLYWDWKKGGGDHSMMVSMDRDYLQDNLGDLLQKYPLRNIVRNPINALRILSELGEAGTRLGEMAAAARKLGTGKAGIQEAAYASREVTLDFNRAGAKTKAVNSIIAFWNAGMQGTDKSIRQFRDNPVGTSVRVAASITLPSVLLAIATHDDERLKEVPQWQKNLFWIVPTENHLWRIPKPFEMGILFGSVPERITHFILDQDPKAFDGVLGSIGRGISPGIVPTILSPIAENWANKSLFFDRAIVPRSREDLLPEYQYGEYTTETAKAIGAIVGKFPGIGDTSAASPAYIENLVQGWTGGLGRYVLNIADAGLKISGTVKQKGGESVSKTTADYPFIKAFAVRFPSAGSASVERFYENYTKAQAVQKTVKVLMEKEQIPEQAMRLWQQSGGADLDGTAKALGTIRNTIDLVSQNQGMTGDEKRELIDTMYLQMIQIAQQGNKVAEEFDKAMKQYR